MTGRPLLAAALTALLMLSWGGCDKKEADAPPPAPKAEKNPHWVEMLTKKPKPPASLREAVQGFRSYSRCLESMERTLPPDLSAHFLRHNDLADALCRTREALATRNPARCDKVTSHSLRKACDITYAIYHGQPEQCPRGYPARRGRDAYCLALATRNPTLCLGARVEEEEVRCRAILGRDADRCGGLTRHSALKRCQAEARRWKGVIDRVQASAPRDYTPTLELKLAGGLAAETIIANCAAGGAVLPTHGSTEQAVLCDFDYYSYRHRSRGRPGSRYVKVELRFKPPSSTNEAIPFGPAARLRLRLVGRREYTSVSGGEIRFSTFERKRGGRIVGTLRASLRGYGGDAIDVEGKLDTFVRDLVDPAELRKSSYRPGSLYGRGSTGSLLGSLRDRNRLGGLLGGLGSGRQTAEAKPRKRFAALLTSAKLTEVTVGQRAGVQVSAILRDSLWERMGIREGDVVFKVGTSQLRSRTHVVRIRRELRGAERLAIRLRRGRRDKTLTLRQPAMSRIQREFEL